MTQIQLVDSHCHLNFPELYASLDDYLAQMQANHVQYALCVGTRPDNLTTVVDIANKHNNIFASIGIHPDEKLDDIQIDEQYLMQYIYAQDKVVAVGETGLDYYHTTSADAKYQHDRFITHVEVAKKTKLPLIIHTRNAMEDTLHILQHTGAKDVGGVMHCFTEDKHAAKKFLDLGFYISISGVVTFKNANTVKEMAQYVPLERLLVETDAPFLAPVPFRGKTNHPALVLHTADYLAGLKGITLSELASSTTNNFFTLFNKAAKWR